ncbi:MAG: hypothetical protein AAB683_00625, partial [Patescibacteria group bacterium]
MSTYSTTDLGNGLYRTQPISVSAAGLISLSKNYGVTCNSIQNVDASWSLKVNEHFLISGNGGFDVNGNPNFTSSTSTGIEDWSFSTGGGSPGRFQVFDNNSASGRVSTDGNKYLKLTSGVTFNSDVKTLESLRGGTVYYDVINFSNGNPDANFTIFFTYDSNGSVQTLYTSNNESSVVGSDKSVAIPNQFGKLTFRVGNATTRSYVLLDNIRYTSPKFSESASCKNLIYAGDVDEKIDIAFIGSGFPDIESLKDGIDFVVDYEGDENGLFSFEPFNSNKNKFNVWMVNSNKTYEAFSQPLNGNLAMFGYDPFYDATAACP